MANKKMDWFELSVSILWWTIGFLVLISAIIGIFDTTGM